MKYVKVLGLAAIAAAALMAFVGASTASATALCKTPGTGEPTGTTCPATKAYPTGTKVHAVNEGIVKLTTEVMDIECSESTVEAGTSSEGDAISTVVAPVSTLTFGLCNCEVKVLKVGSLEVHWIAGGSDGTVTSSGTEVTVTCNLPLIGKLHCIYATSDTDLGTLTGGSSATIDIDDANITQPTTSSLCGGKASLDARYSVTSPTPLYVTSHT